METTWPLDTVMAVRRLYMRCDVALEVMDYAPEALDAYRDKLAHQLCREAQTYGVDPHPGDVVFDERPSESRPFCTAITARWAPSTTEVELSCAGPHDGRVMSIPNVWVPFRIPVATRVTAYSNDAEPMNMHYQELRLAGWRETARRWVFRES